MLTRIQLVTNHRTFNKSKCRVLHLGWDNLESMDKLGDETLESSPTERDEGGGSGW